MAGTPSPDKLEAHGSMAKAELGWLRTLAIGTGYILAYVFLDRVSYVLPVAPLGISPWNPPPGASLVLMLRFGLRWWPLQWLASIAAETYTRGLPSPQPLLVAAVLITLVYGGAAALLKRRMTDGWRLACTRDLYLFVGITLAATLVVAAGYVAIFAVAGDVPWSRYLDYSLRFWVGDMDGILVATPLLLIAWPRWRRPSLRTVLETLMQAATVTAVLWLIFRVTIFDEFKSFYLLFLPLIWIAARWRLFGAVLALAWIQLGLIVAVQTQNYDGGIFAQLQFLMLMLAVTGLALGMYVEERAQAYERLRLKQASLDRALRFAAAGELSSALAHELNQPIAALRNYLEICRLLLDAQTGDQQQLRATLDKASAEGLRASAVVRRLRDFFRNGHSDLAECDTQRLLTSLAANFEPRAEAARIGFRLRVDGPLPLLIADTLQLETALNNLLNNALESLQGMRPAAPRIELSARASGTDVEFRVDDNGAGLHSEIADRLFEPFATTKAQGMGLGLAISRTLVEAHGGRLWLQTPRDGGCSFRIRLPLRPPEVSSAHLSASHEART